MSGALRRRARRHGTKSIYAGGEPRNHELVEHWHRWPMRKPYHSPQMPKRMAKLKWKDRANKRAVEASYRARLTSPWPIYLKEGGS
jgi:hypothetical protein